MTLSILPAFRGLDWGSKATPRFNNHIAKSPNGYEVRTNLQDQPLWDFEISYEFLANRKMGARDLETIQQFFLERKGSFESFLFAAPETPMEVNTVLGTGDGVVTDFDLLKTTGTYTELAGGTSSATDMMVYLDGVPQVVADYTLIDSRTIRFDTAPAASVVVSADYLPLFRVRFSQDMAHFDQFMTELWQLQQLELTGVFQ
jgi:uncharacterized protein (TIGR02217 family)